MLEPNGLVDQLVEETTAVCEPGTARKNLSIQRIGRTELALLYPAFPVLHQTFVLWEALALEELGFRLFLYSIKRPRRSEVQQPEAETFIRRVHYLPNPFSTDVVRAYAMFVRQRPGAYRYALTRLWKEWRQDLGLEVLRQRRSERGNAQAVPLRARIEELVNTSPVVYFCRSLALLPLAAYLGPLLQRNGITHVHAHWATFATTLALYLKWLFGIRFSFTAHAYDLYLMPLLLPVKLRESELVVTCAKVNAEFLRRLPNGERANIRVNYHGVDLARFSPLPKPELSTGRPRIVTCGSLRLYKGHHVLISALAQMEHRADCVIIGDGPQRENLEKLAVQLGVRERVEFAGAVPQERAAQRYAEADVFVLASTVFRQSGRQDVIPNVLVEAMAMGLPVVSTTLPGIQELIDDGVHGRLVPPDQPARLAQAIDELLADPEKRMRLAAAGRQRVLERFDRSKNVIELARLFRQLGPAEVGSVS